MKIYSKFRPRKLCTGLTLREFRCKCHNNFCKATLVDEKLVEAYSNFRTFVDLPLKINSGYRCQKHNHMEDGASCSRHLAGQAIDIDIRNLMEIYTIDRIQFIAKESGFTYIKYYPKEHFMHFDVREIDNA